MRVINWSDVNSFCTRSLFQPTILFYEWINDIFDENDYKYRNSNKKKYDMNNNETSDKIKIEKENKKNETFDLLSSIK